MQKITSGSELKRMYPNRDLFDEMRDHNARVQHNANIRIRKYYEDIRQNSVQIFAPASHETNIPQMFRGMVDRLKQVQGNYSLFHFTLQLGRLRIELSKANNSGRPTNG